jgi:uncharacterized protein (TIGR03437 family)
MRQIVILLLFVAVAFAQTPATGFTDTLVARVPSPTAIAFLPDGRILAASQGGRLSIIRDGALLPAPALEFSAQEICSNSERGLLGVAIDPAFAAEPYVYLYYTHRAMGRDCSTRSPSGPVNRVSRFTMRGDTLDRASERVLIDNIPSFAGNHNAGDLKFGPGGYLFVSVGDSGCDPRPGGGCAGENAYARETNTLAGKVLRITRDGEPAPGNLWPDGVRCNHGTVAVGQRCAEVYATGLRNAFRLAVSDAEVRANDVGQGAWEEINVLAPADYGWNLREGPCRNGSTTDCPTPPAGLTDPVFAYRHDRPVPGTTLSNCRSIGGGAFIPSGIWPAAFNGYAFSDFVCGGLFTLSAGASGASLLASNLGNIVSTEFGPWQNTKALYYTTYARGGEVRRISYLPALAAQSPFAPEAIATIYGPFGESGEVIFRGAGEDRASNYFFRSANQINFQVPPLPPGRYEVLVRSGGADRAFLFADLQPVAPYIFTADFRPDGVPAAQYVLPFFGADAFQCSAPGVCQPFAVDVSGGQTVLVLYTTGLRRRSSLDRVEARIAGRLLPVEYAGPQSQTPGLDQVNVRLPASLAGTGATTLTLVVDGESSNTVRIAIR